MKLFRQKKKGNYGTSVNVKGRSLLFSLSFFICTAILLACLPIVTANAATGIKIYNYTTKKESNYTDKQIKVVYNGQKVTVDKTPAILIDGIALVSYKDLLVNSDIKADCVYNSSKGTLSITKAGTKIDMTLGSTKAYVNGKAVTMNAAPVKIKYIDAGNITKVLVPSRFVCETFGYGYNWNSGTGTVTIDKSFFLELSFNKGQSFVYKGTQGKVTIDGKNVSLGNMPGILTNDTVMLRAKRVFADSKIGASYKYNSSDKSIRLLKDGNELLMIIGSSTAYLNGNAMKMDAAPLIITNKDTDSSYVMVPGYFTADCLGYDYTWNKVKKTSVITSRKSGTGSGTPGGSSTEPGDSGVNVKEGTVIKSFSSGEASQGKSSGVTEIDKEGSAEKSGDIISVSRDNNNIKQNSETYTITGSAPFGKVTSSKSGNIISIQAAGIKCSDQYYQIYGISGNLLSFIHTTYNNDNAGSLIELSANPGQYDYDISLSADRLTLYVTIYINRINTVKIGTNDKEDYIALTGIDLPKASITETNGLLYIDFPYTANGIGDQNYTVSGAKYLNNFYIVGLTDKTQMIIGVKEGTEYFLTDKGNQLTICFYDPSVTGKPGDNGQTGQQGNSGQTGSTGQQGNSGQDSKDTQPGQNGGTGEPSSIDKSKYEIIIPKPADITKKMLTDEDDYYNNRFYITLPGDYTSIITKNKITANSSVIKDITVSLNSKNKTVVRITTSKLQGYEYVTDQNNIYIHIGNPRDIYKNIVVLDPGHGGSAGGAQYFGTDEKDVNLEILYEVGRKYFNSDTSKLKVYYTRQSDVDKTLNDRATYAQKIGADLFVSLHMNASTSSAPYGTELYYSENNNKANAAGLNSKDFASIMLKNLAGGLGTSNRGVKSEAYTVVHRNTVPAILIELGFLSNKNDFAKLSDPAFQDKAAKIIYETLLQVFEMYPTGR